jgi:hypothetical protein
MFNQVRRMVRVNSRSMIIVITFFFVLLVGRFTQSAAVAANTSLSLSAYSLDTQPSGSETSGLIGTAIAVVGGIVTFLTAVVTYFRTVRERKGETMTDALPVAQLSLALDAQEEEGKEDLKKRRTQRETQATGWLMYGLAFLIVPLQLVFTLVLPSIFTGGPGLGGFIDFLFDRDPTGGFLAGILIGAAFPGLVFLFFYLWRYFRAWHRLRRAPLEGPTVWRREVVVVVDPACRNDSLLEVCKKALQVMGGHVTEIDLKQNRLAGKLGRRASGYDEISVHIKRGANGDCSLTIASDGVRPTVTDDKSRHFSNLRRFTELIIG